MTAGDPNTMPAAMNSRQFHAEEPPELGEGRLTELNLPGRRLLLNQDTLKLCMSHYRHTSVTCIRIIVCLSS